MDFKARELSWQGQINAVFSNGNTNIVVTDGLQFDDLFKNIKNLTYKRTRAWWSKAFLENYIQHQLIPRGLRIHVTPAFPVTDEGFIKSWEGVCNTASKQLMELLVQYNSQNISNIDKLLDEVYVKAKNCLSAEQLSSMDGLLEKQMDQWIKDIQTTQKSKLIRDQRDFSSGKIYRWRKQQQDGNTRDRFDSTTSNLAPVNVSGASSSASVSTLASMASTPKRKREPRYTPAKRNYRPNADNNLKVINLSNHVLTESEINVLKKGLTFCPTAQFDKFIAIKDLHLFARKLMFKKHFHNEELFKLFPTEAEQEALETLEELAQEHNEPLGASIHLPLMDWDSMWSFLACVSDDLTAGLDALVEPTIICMTVKEGRK
ncbi:uncharacterized protein [Ranitomeya imitator]|uniref:uncharacterized protein n=1 Tax=Ranitomeya imitator TaxID=111125 RepID=UPI0037E7EF97